MQFFVQLATLVLHFISSSLDQIKWGQRPWRTAVQGQPQARVTGAGCNQPSDKWSFAQGDIPFLLATERCRWQVKGHSEEVNRLDLPTRLAQPEENATAVNY